MMHDGYLLAAAAVNIPHEQCAPSTTSRKFLCFQPAVARTTVLDGYLLLLAACCSLPAATRNTPHERCRVRTAEEFLFLFYIYSANDTCMFCFSLDMCKWWVGRDVTTTCLYVSPACLPRHKVLLSSPYLSCVHPYVSIFRKTHDGVFLWKSAAWVLLRWNCMHGCMFTPCGTSRRVIIMVIIKGSAYCAFSDILLFGGPGGTLYAS
ncbi:uncharacterized protein K489DRAFT_169848 [Dissoconium aciculare CBS 342.82]|uniref:Uncharacterized protein n=1 Tax=Dissoconium aciculare CBS 342.82 TaxID=1314786 RepID=A0A6J3M8M1_9PEZI|nr:uncharacterized protein K489DRAFT_169848 [Dissoconium aciculare CBS 342.82]KAF1823949.1 hypothetical protein K489DRAFT_169848 [Dissoconium aciculare CBS 342.82]